MTTSFRAHYYGEKQEADHVTLEPSAMHSTGSMGTTVEPHDDDCLASPPYENVESSCPGAAEEYEMMSV